MTQTLEAFPVADFTKERTITLSDKRLKELWEAGILPPAAYLAFILAFIDTKKQLYPEVIATEWRGTTDDRGKAKELTIEQIERALLTLRSKSLIGIQSKPIQLSFSFWADGYQEAQ